MSKYMLIECIELAVENEDKVSKKWFEKALIKANKKEISENAKKK
jgi:hypothetical protein